MVGRPAGGSRGSTGRLVPPSSQQKQKGALAGHHQHEVSHGEGNGGAQTTVERMEIRQAIAGARIEKDTAQADDMGNAQTTARR